MSNPITTEQLHALGKWAVEVPAVPLWVEADIVAIITELRLLREERAGGWAKRAVAEQKRADAAEDQMVLLVEKIAAMRAAQKDYFRSRHQEALTLSKKLEREVDDFLKVIASGEPMQEQGRLI